MSDGGTLTLLDGYSVCEQLQQLQQGTQRPSERGLYRPHSDGCCVLCHTRGITML